MEPGEELEVWEDIEDSWPLVRVALAKVQAGCLERLINAQTTADIEEVRLLQGKVEALKIVANLPAQRIGELKQQIDKETKHGR